MRVDVEKSSRVALIMIATVMNPQRTTLVSTERALSMRQNTVYLAAEHTSSFRDR